MKTLFLNHFFRGRLTFLTVLEFSVRGWLGYILVINAPVGVTIPLDSLGLPQDAYLLIKALWDTGYLMHTVKAIELLGGLALLLNVFTPLALVILMPVVINILGIGVFILHSYHSGPRMMVAMIFLMGMNYRAYLPLLKADQNSPLITDI